jgi:hypothetical protein
MNWKQHGSCCGQKENSALVHGPLATSSQYILIVIYNMETNQSDIYQRLWQGLLAFALTFILLRWIF